MTDRKRGKERDLVLAPNEFAYVSDQTKGNINVYVGPHKASLSATDQPVVFDPITKRFKNVMLNEAIQPFAVAPEGWYISLKNPAKENKLPGFGTPSTSPDLEVGHKVNIPGPASFALWPGQMVRLLKGHNLRSNQYLVARVYDAVTAEKSQGITVPVEGEAETTPRKYTMGQLLIIKGTSVSFYIPPSGVEIVMDVGEYVRDAVTLERLEYCVLLDEDGNKRFVKGPAVVFPSPTEDFLTGSSGSRKFKAIGLNKISGLYLQVIAEYTEGEDGKNRKVGDELFITGKDQMVYFPREEHAIIKYGQQDIHYAVAIPKGEARYVMDRLGGEIRLENGPKMFLADPRKDVGVRRIIDPRDAAIWFPNSEDAVAYNLALLEAQRDAQPGSGQMYMSDDIFSSEKTRSTMSKKLSAFYDDTKGGRGVEPFAASAGIAFRERPGRDQMADQVQRKQTFTPPRTVTLDTKYEGAIAIDVWTGYAILVKSKSGDRKVVVGPKRHILECDEILEAITLSAGFPKGSRPKKNTVYLRVLHNKVSDMVNVESSDYFSAEIHLSYRVNFEGDPKKWFDVEDYIKFLTDHLRSLLKGIVKKIGIEDFYANYTDIIRDAILGKSAEGKREGRIFSENGMRIYDIDIQNVNIKDAEVEQMLVNSQTAVFQQGLKLKAANRNLELTKALNKITQDESEDNHNTTLKTISLALAEVKKSAESAVEYHKIELARKKEEGIIAKEVDKTLDATVASELGREKAEQDQKLALEGKELLDKIKWLEAEVKAAKDKGGAYSPDFIAALTSIANLGMAETVAEAFSIPALIGGKDVVDVAQQMLGSIPGFSEAISNLKMKRERLTAHN